MNKLIISLLNKNSTVNAHKLMTNVLMTRHVVPSASLFARNSHHVAPETPSKPPAKSDTNVSVNELDKPQWERSDRFVSEKTSATILHFILYQIFNFVLITNKKENILRI